MTLAVEGEIVAAPEAEALRGAQRGIAGRMLLLFALVSALGLLFDAVVAPPDPAVKVRSWSSPLADGFAAGADLAARLGHRVLRQRASWGQLPAAGEHTLVVVDPRPLAALFADEAADLDGTQLRALERWVEAGGHLVLAPAGRRRLDLFGADLDALELPGDDPTIAIVGTGLAFVPVPLPALLGASSVAPTSSASPAATSSPLSPAPGVLLALGPKDELHAAAWLTWGGRPLTLNRPPVPAELAAWDPTLLPPGFTRRVDLGPAPFVLEAVRGRGRIWLLASAYPFTGLALANGGAAPLVAGLLHEATEGGRRALLLDDRGHGLGARRGLLGPLRDAGLAAPVVALLGLVALVAWRGGVRDGPPRPPRGAPRRAKEEFVVALADLLRRGGRRDAAARALGHAWRERLGSLASGPELAPLLARAEGQAPADDEALAALARSLQEASARAVAGEARKPSRGESP